MQCFSFIKTMMILFNTLIFVSMETVCPMGGSLQEQVTISAEPKLGNGKLRCPDFALQVSPPMLIPGSSKSQAATRGREAM